MASRKFDDLSPHMAYLAQMFVDAAKKEGIDVLITCTYRSGIEQTTLYVQGRSMPGRIVTNAKPGESLHNCMINGQPAARAFDVVPMILGKPMWEDDHPHWETLGQIGESLGLKWGGRWKKPDKPHFELPEPATKETA